MKLQLKSLFHLILKKIMYIITSRLSLEKNNIVTQIVKMMRIVFDNYTIIKSFIIKKRHRYIKILLYDYKYSNYVQLNNLISYVSFIY